MDTDAIQLRVFGFSPAKAMEISLDAKRGDHHALGVLKMAKHKCHMIVEAYTRGYSPSRICRDENVAEKTLCDFIDMMKLSMNYLFIALGEVLSCELA